MDLTLREGCSIKFYMKLLQLATQFFHITNIINEFIYYAYSITEKSSSLAYLK
jgi:hypothetical protein